MDTMSMESQSSECESLDKYFTSDIHTAEIPSQFADLYKALARNRETSQNERRKLFLEEIRRKRHEIFDENRDFGDETTEDDSVEMDVDQTVKKRKKYGNYLMFTEWLCEVPSDLDENWFVKFCPYGKRCLVVAEKYKTATYNRKGIQLGGKFSSLLPGGNRNGQRNKFTMLECLYNSDLNCYFVLDVLYWNSMSMRQQTVDFRFFWLRSKFAEIPELSIASDRNKYEFRLLDYAPANASILTQILNTVPSLNGKNFLYDGILFYHKESVYLSGFTPLVTWLKPYMVPEVFGVEINEIYFEKKPKDYENFYEFIRKLSSRKEFACDVDFEALEII